MFDFFTAFVGGVYCTLLFLDPDYPPVYPEIHGYRNLLGLIWLAVLAANIALQWRDRRTVPNG